MTVKQLSERIETLEAQIAELKAQAQPAQIHHHYHYEAAPQPQPITYPDGQWPYQWWYTNSVVDVNGTSSFAVSATN